MARTGLRMMPTSPSSPLKFRTAGFPQYGFKASMSERASLPVRFLKPAPGIQSLTRSLLLPFARFHPDGSPGSVSQTVGASTCRCSGGLSSLPQGSLAPDRVMLSRSIIAYYSPMRQSRRHTATSRLCAYTQRLRCAGAPRRPARPSLLSLPCFPCMPSTLLRWSTVPSRCIRTMIPDFLELLPSRLTTIPSLPAISDGEPDFGAASFALYYGLHVCLALLAGYDVMKSYALHRAFRGTLSLPLLASSVAGRRWESG